MRGFRSRRDTMTMPNGTTQLINPKLENLSIGPLPTDSTNIVIAGSNDLGITDKLNALIDEYKPEMVRLPSMGACASSITAKLPREFIQSLYDTLNVNNNGCLQETQTLLQMLISYLSSTTDGYINIPRNFWKQVGRVFNELNVNESKINMYAAAMRSMSMAITTDAQSLPSNNLLVSSLESASDLSTSGVDPIDDDFQTMYPESILPQPEPNELMTQVIEQVPTTVGESSSMPPTNMIDLTASAAADNIQIHDLDDMTNIEAQSYSGLKEIFSTKMLAVPIESLKLINNGNVTTYAPVTTNVITDITFDGTTLTPTTTPITTLTEVTTSVALIDTSKSLLEQDWALTGTGMLRNIDAPKWINTIDFIKPSVFKNYTPDVVFRGVNSRREYTLNEARSLGSALSAMWNKVVSMKLPTPQHIQTGTSILAAGLGAAGSLFGSSGLVTASKVVGSLSDGLGSFIANLTPTNGLAPEPKASIPKNALAVVPAVIEAGKSIYEGISINAQQQRIKLNGVKKEVETGYTMPSSEMMLRSRMRRTNNVFY